MKILKVEHLTKTYKLGNTSFKALDNISFSVNKGEFVAIVGASGSGKSTLLHILGSVENASSGSVFIDNIDITKLSDNELCSLRRRKIGLIYQFYNLIPILNVEENISMPLLLDKQKINKKHLDNLISVLQLEKQRLLYPNQLSGGQQQRVAIARSLIYSPSIILADEPTGNLDSINSENVVNFFKKLNTELNQTLILVTHNSEIAKKADRIITIKDGKIISDISNRKSGE